MEAIEISATCHYLKRLSCIIAFSGDFTCIIVVNVYPFCMDSTGSLTGFSLEIFFSLASDVFTAVTPSGFFWPYLSWSAVIAAFLFASRFCCFKLSLSSKPYLLINYFVDATLFMPLPAFCGGAIAWPGTPFMLTLITFINSLIDDVIIPFKNHASYLLSYRMFLLMSEYFCWLILFVGS